MKPIMIKFKSKGNNRYIFVAYYCLKIRVHVQPYKVKCFHGLVRLMEKVYEWYLSFFIIFI